MIPDFLRKFLIGTAKSERRIWRDLILRADHMREECLPQAIESVVERGGSASLTGGSELCHLGEFALDNFPGQRQRHCLHKQNLRRPLVRGKMFCGVLC